MKRPVLTPEEKLWQQVWRTWPNAMQYEQMDVPFDAPFRRANSRGTDRSRAWLQAKQQQQASRP